VLQSVVVCCSLLHCVAGCCGVSVYVAVFLSMLRCFCLCCVHDLLPLALQALRRLADEGLLTPKELAQLIQPNAVGPNGRANQVGCSVWQCVAVCCSVVQCVAV